MAFYNGGPLDYRKIEPMPRVPEYHKLTFKQWAVWWGSHTIVIVPAALILSVWWNLAWLFYFSRLILVMLHNRRLHRQFARDIDAWIGRMHAYYEGKIIQYKSAPWN